MIFAGLFHKLPATSGLSGRAVAAVLSGILVSVSLSVFPGSWLIAWVALVPLLLVLRSVPGRDAFLTGALFGLANAASLLFWMPSTVRNMAGSYSTGFIIFFLFCGFWTVFYGCWALLHSVTVRTISREKAGNGRALVFVVIAACLWSAAEYVHGLVLGAFGTRFVSGLGNSQAAVLPLCQLAAAGGVALISFLIAAMNLAVAYVLTVRLYKPLLIVLSAAALCVAGGWFRMKNATAPGQGSAVKVAVLHGNIPISYRFEKANVDFFARRYIELARQANRSKPQLVVWPESAVPWPIDGQDDLIETVLAETYSSAACHIVGTVVRRSGGGSNLFHNTALFVLPDGRITGIYNKNRMLAVAERPVTIPLLDRSFSFSRDPRVFQFAADTVHEPLRTPLGVLGLTICNEGFFPESTLEHARRGVDFIVNIGNDSFCSSDITRRQHFAANMFRAIESGREIVVANNCGISGVIDAYGRVRVQSRPGTPEALSALVFKTANHTLYTAIGDSFPWLCAILWLASMVAARGLTRRSHNP